MTQRILVLALAIQSVATLLLATLVVAPRGAAAPAPQEAASVAPAPPASVAEQRIRVTNSLSLGEARAIVDAAVAYVRAENGRTAIAVVDDHGDTGVEQRSESLSVTAFGCHAKFVDAPVVRRAHEPTP